MVLLLTLLVVSACGEKPEEETTPDLKTQEEKLQDQATDVEVEVSQEDDEESKDEKQKVEFENPGEDAPEDQVSYESKGRLIAWVILDCGSIKVSNYMTTPES